MSVVPVIGAAWNARENAVILTHDGECVALPIETAIVPLTTPKVNPAPSVRTEPGRNNRQAGM